MESLGRGIDGRCFPDIPSQGNQQSVAFVDRCGVPGRKGLELACQPDGLSETHASLTSMPSQSFGGEIDPGWVTGIPTLQANLLKSSKQAGDAEVTETLAKECTRMTARE